MNKADWRLLEKIQAGSLSDDEAYLLEREEDAYALAQAGYILIIGPGKQGSPHEGKCCARHFAAAKSVKQRVAHCLSPFSCALKVYLPPARQSGLPARQTLRG